MARRTAAAKTRHSGVSTVKSLPTASLVTTLTMLGLLGVSPVRAQETPVPVPNPVPTPKPATPPAVPVPVPVTPVVPTPSPATPTSVPLNPGTPAIPGTPTPPEGTPAGTPATTPTPAPVASPTTPAPTTPPPAVTGPTPPPTPGTSTPIPGVKGYSQNSAGRLLGSWAKDITISGGMSVRAQQNAVAGGAGGLQTFTDQNINSLDARQSGPFQQSYDMLIQGRVLNAFTINAQLSNAQRGNVFNQVFGINYKSRDNKTSLDLGNVNASLPGNELVTFSRSLQGLMVSRDFGNRMKVTGLASLTRAVSRRGSFQGQGTSGPYYMNASSLVPGSERVELNGRSLVAGTDYTIDYFLGQIKFLGSLIVNPSDTVTFSYEAQNYNTTPGLLTGTRIDYAGNKGNAYGVTFLKQKSSGFGNADRVITERYPVVTDLTYHYTLSSLIDPAYPVKVAFQNQTLVEGVDYSLNRDLRFVLLRREFPADTSFTATASLQITYKPQQQASVTGDRDVVGLDSTLRLAPNGTMGIQFGRSQSETGTQNGQGVRMTTNWTSPKRSAKNAWALSLGYSDIGQGFSSIDSVASAYLQAQKGINGTFTLTPNAFYNISTGFTQSRVANQGYAGTGAALTAAPVVWATNQSFNTDIKMVFPHLPSLTLSHGQTTQSSGSDSASKSSFINDALSINWTKGIWGLSSELRRTASQGRSIFSSQYNNSVATSSFSNGSILDQAKNGSFSQSVSDSTSTTSRVSLSVQPATWIGLKGDLGLSRNSTGASTGTTSLSGTQSTARDTGLGITLMPLPNMNLSAQLSDSTNGQSTAGFYGNTTNTTGTNGTQLGVTLTGQRTRSSNYSLTYSPIERLSLSLNSSRQLSLIPGYDNTESATTSFIVGGAPMKLLRLDWATQIQRSTYVGGQGNSNTRSYQLSGTVGPFGKLTFTPSFLRMYSDSAIYSGNAAINGGLDTSIPIRSVSTGRQTSIGNSIGNYNNGLGSGTGYLQNGVNTSMTMRVDYNLGTRYSLFGQWQSIDQSSPLLATTGGANSSNNSAYHTATNFRQGVGGFGLDLKLNELMTFTTSVNLINRIDRDDSRYSYSARTMGMDLSARF